MNLQEILTEWRRGCSCAPVAHPELCQSCTVAALVAVRRRGFAAHPVDVLVAAASGSGKPLDADAIEAMKLMLDSPPP